MIPKFETDLVNSFDVTEDLSPKKVYKIDWDNNRLLTQKLDGVEAVSQNVKVITSVEHLEHITMPESFGIAMKDMYGMPREYVKANMERIIKEALSPYRMITKASNFVIEDIDEYSISVTFTLTLADGTSYDEFLEVAGV